MESNHPPPLYQRGVLPLNYAPKFLEYLILYAALKIKINVISDAEIRQ